jgi:hypothetical protein
MARDHVKKRRTETPIELGKRSDAEKEHEQLLRTALLSGAIPDEELVSNLHVFLKRQTVSHLLQLNEFYQRILHLPGAIFQCGVRWGGDLLLFSKLRALYEPYNYSRRIVGFDTFAGLKGTGAEDRGSERLRDGQFSVTKGYAALLEELMAGTESVAPISHLRKFQLVTGDVRQTLPQFLEENPGESIAMLYLDMDIYDPTRDALAACADRLLPGSIVVFDEFGAAQFAGEATAAREVARQLKLRFFRTAFSTVAAYAVVDG